MDTATALEHAYQHTHEVIANVRPDQYGLETPCTEWTVRDLMEHLIGVVAGLGAAAAGRERTAFELSDDPAAQFDDAADQAIVAWRAEGVMDRMLESTAGPMPGNVLAAINLLDTATHTWDLAKATGQDPTLPDDVAEAAYEASTMIVSPERRAGRFAPEVATPSDADPTARLVAFLGRVP
jgi:uncharacterized protein (TIGR03086 family)